MKLRSVVLASCLGLLACGPDQPGADGGVVGGGGGSMTGGGAGGGGGSATGGGGGSMTGGGGGAAGGGGSTGGGGGGTGGGSTGGGGGDDAGTAADAGPPQGPTWAVYWDGGAAEDAGDLTSFRVPSSSVGQRFAGYCPPDSPERTIYGTDVYTHDSSYCTAAAHLGLITLDGGGPLTVETRPGMRAFATSTRFGITSRAYATWNTSVAFVSADGGFEGDVAAAEGWGHFDWWDGGSAWDGGAVQDAGTITWNNHGSTYRNFIGQRFAFLCTPPVEDKNVWGTGLYTIDSSICRAGTHTGVIDEDGGVVVLEVLPGAESYVGSTANGVTTLSYGPFTASFLIIP